MVDLRSDYDRVYNQGPDNACGPFAVCAALDCMYERKFNTPHRFDKDHIWGWVRFYRGMQGTNTGADFDSLEKTLRLNGARLADGSTITGFKLERTYVSDNTYSELKQLLAMGFPVIWLMKVTPDFNALSDQRNWKQHSIGRDTVINFGMHFVCIVGYDDQAQRWLVENSWGADWGDGGFFGVPYASFQSLTEGLMHIDIAPINPKPVEGYSVPVSVMFSRDKAAFTDRAAGKLTQVLTAAFANGGPAELIAECKSWGVSDKHLESLLGWQRGTIRSFREEHPDFDWADFVWDQI